MYSAWLPCPQPCSRSGKWKPARVTLEAAAGRQPAWESRALTPSLPGYLPRGRCLTWAPRLLRKARTKTVLLRLFLWVNDKFLTLSSVSTRCLQKGQHNSCTSELQHPKENSHVDESRATRISCIFFLVPASQTHFPVNLRVLVLLLIKWAC